MDGARPRPVRRPARNVRDWIHVDDHSSAVWAVLTRGLPGETYLVGADGERSNIDVLREVLKAFGRPEDGFDRVRDRPGHDRRYAIDASKIRRELGWEPARRDFAAGLADTVAWYRANEAWWRAGQGGRRGPLPRAGAVKRPPLQAAFPRQVNVAQQPLQGLEHHGVGDHRERQRREQRGGEHQHDDARVDHTYPSVGAGIRGPISTLDSGECARYIV